MFSAHLIAASVGPPTGRKFGDAPPMIYHCRGVEGGKLEKRSSSNHEIDLKLGDGLPRHASYVNEELRSAVSPPS